MKATKEGAHSISVNSLAEKAMRQAVEKVIQAHRIAGLPLAVWRDGKVVHIPAPTLAVRESPGPDSVKKTP
jgi:hypothetical protein